MKKENFTLEYGHVSQNVLEMIREEVNSIGYNFIIVLRKSLHPDDKDLYVVVAKRETVTIPTYAFWSCYNDSRKTLNHGHYGYKDLNECIKAASEFVV